KIVAKSALAAVIDEQEAQIQQQLLKLRDMQEKAIKKVIGAEQQWKATGTLRPEDLVELAEAEQIQKDIEARIGTKKDEGLRGELRGILQEQQERQQEIEKLLAKVKEAGSMGVLKTSANKAELRRTAELQRRLADRTKQLLDKMKTLSAKAAGQDERLQEMLD